MFIMLNRGASGDVMFIVPVQLPSWKTLWRISSVALTIKTLVPGCCYRV